MFWFGLGVGFVLALGVVWAWDMFDVGYRLSDFFFKNIR